jgi:hypothetical protein
MMKKLFCVALSALLLHAAVTPALAKSGPDKEAERAAKVRARLAELGTGPKARIRVELRDGTKVEGYVSEAGPDSFVVTDATDRTTSVPYAQVKKLRGDNSSTGKRIALTVGVGALVALSVVIVAVAAVALVGAVRGGD